jgi:eukaryotic-like serine/threonine-protein kinase
MPSGLLQGDPAELGGYRLGGRLGAGGMGRVYLAFTPGGRPVAMKVLRPELGDDPEFRARFRQEIAAARRVSGLFTAQVLDGDPEGSPPWLVTTYVPGPSLDEAVARHGPLPEATVLLLMAGVAEALVAIHAAGLVHRDLKPSNVLLATDGPRVIDFGIARAVHAPAMTRAGFRIGSPQFMAPEQWEGGPLTAATDVFALGALAAFAATGRPPFGGGDETAVWHRVMHSGPDLAGCPGLLVGLIRDCLATDPWSRPTPTQVIEQCRAVVPGTLEFTPSWLPPAVAADLAHHGAPPTPPAPRTPATAQRTYTAEQAGPAAQPTGGPTIRRTLLNTGGLSTEGPVPQPRRQSRAVVAGAIACALVVAGLAGYGVAAALGVFSHGGSQNTAASQLDACLFGTWTMTSAGATFDGQNVVYSGQGPTATFQSNGVQTYDYGTNTTLNAQAFGSTYTIAYSGSATSRYATNRGKLLTSDLSAHGSYTLLRNGTPYRSIPLTSSSGTTSVPYSCSAGTLQISLPSGITEILSRDKT